MEGQSSKYDQLIAKYSAPKEEQDKQHNDQAVKLALRKKKNKAFEQYNAALEAEDDARIAFEKAVINPNVIAFDAQYLSLQQAEATTKLYKSMYEWLFGSLPQA